VDYNCARRPHCFKVPAGAKLPSRGHVVMRAFLWALTIVSWGVVCVGCAAAATCANPDALGVERDQVIDAAGGLRFGSQMRGSQDFLQDHEVVLTFDDGPFPVTTETILSALDAECTKATFFYVGTMALAYPQILKDVDSHGETIGTHTWRHANMRTLFGVRAQAEIEKGISMLEARLGHPIAPFFRFPYLNAPNSDVSYLATRGFAVFSIDVDSWDSHGQFVSAERIINVTMSRLKVAGKGIILMHDIKRSTAAALPTILRQLKANGFKVVHLVPKDPATSLAPFDQLAEHLIADHDLRAGRTRTPVANLPGNDLTKRVSLTTEPLGDGEEKPTSSESKSLATVPPPPVTGPGTSVTGSSPEMNPSTVNSQTQGSGAAPKGAAIATTGGALMPVRRTTGGGSYASTRLVMTSSPFALTRH
jgi:peptidoglycan-N-acetylglucosamine deacetylase